MPYFEDNSISHDISTDAGFRAWVQMIHDGLDAVGLVQTADTGQIDPETVETPSANNTDAGYEVWRFDDDAQATDPIFIWIAYGRAGGPARPRFRHQFGRSSDGSGGLGTGSTIRSPGMITDPPGGDGIIAIGLADGALFVYIIPNPSTVNNTTFGFFVERLRRPDGSLRPGWFVAPSFANSNFASRDYFDSAVWGVTDRLTPSGPSLPSDGEVVFGGVRFGVRPSAPLRSLLTADPAAVAAGDTGEVDGRNYKMIADGAPGYIQRSLSVSTFPATFLVRTD